MHWLLWLEFTVLSLFMQSPIYTSDFAKMLIIFKVPTCHDQGPGYLTHNFMYSTAPDTSTLQYTISSLGVSQFEVCMRIAEDYSLQACTNRIIKHSGLFILYDLYSSTFYCVMAMEIWFK